MPFDPFYEYNNAARPLAAEPSWPDVPSLSEDDLADADAINAQRLTLVARIAYLRTLRDGQARPPEFSRVQRFSAAGSYSWTVPADVTRVRIVAVDGGTAGFSGTALDQRTLGSANRSVAPSPAPGMGGEGGDFREITVSVTPGTLISVFVGKGGTPDGLAAQTGARSYATYLSPFLAVDDKRYGQAGGYPRFTMNGATLYQLAQGGRGGDAPAGGRGGAGADLVTGTPAQPGTWPGGGGGGGVGNGAVAAGAAGADGMVEIWY